MEELLGQDKARILEVYRLEFQVETRAQTNQALELHSPLPKSFKVCKERTMEKRKNRGKLAAVFFRTFGALTEVHFLHTIYHFKDQEVKNPTLQTEYDLELK